jgi:hypothetical protein
MAPLDSSGSAPDDDPEGEETPPKRVRTAAEDLVTVGEERGHDLDFSPASLAGVDTLVSAVQSDDRDGDGDGDDDLNLDALGVAEREVAVTRLGCYVGETLVRSYDAAEWAETDDGWTVVVDGPGDRLTVKVFDLAADFLDGNATVTDLSDALAEGAGVDAPRIVPADGDTDASALAVQTPGPDYDPDSFRSDADAFVDRYPRYGLDYTPESLDALDGVVFGELSAGDDLAGAYSGTALSEMVRELGAYFGETLVVSLDGAWTHDGEWTVDIADRSGTVGVAVFEAALAALQGDLAFGAVYDRLAGDIEAGVEAEARAGVGAGGGIDGSIDAAMVARAEAFAGRWPDYDLDFSPASLARLDDLAATEFERFTGRERASGELVETATAFAAYFGEVLRREHDAAWVDDDGPAVALETDDGDDAVGVDAVEAAATCVAGNLSFVATYEGLLAAR